VFYPLPKMSVNIDAEFLYSDNLETVETGAKSIGKSSDILSLILGLAIIRIERDGLWRQAGFDNLRSYRVAQHGRLNMPKSSISTKRRVAEAWLAHKRLLSRVPIDGHVSKLVFLNEAMRLHQDHRLVLDHFKKDSYDAFRLWARPDLKRPELPAVAALITDSGITIDGRPVLQWPDDFPENERAWLGRILERSYAARAGGNVAHVVPVYDDGEARAVDNFLKKLRSSK